MVISKFVNIYPTISRGIPNDVLRKLGLTSQTWGGWRGFATPYS